MWLQFMQIFSRSLWLANLFYSFCMIISRKYWFNKEIQEVAICFQVNSESVAKKIEIQFLIDKMLTIHIWNEWFEWPHVKNRHLGHRKQPNVQRPFSIKKKVQTFPKTKIVANLVHMNNSLTFKITGFLLQEIPSWINLRNHPNRWYRLMLQIAIHPNPFEFESGDNSCPEHYWLWNAF